MYSTPDFRKGLKVELDGTPYSIVDFQHVKPGKGGAFVRTKLKNLLTGGIIDKTFRAGEKVGKPDINQSNMQFLYSDGDGYHFMNVNTYDQVQVPEDEIGSDKDFLKENTIVEVLEYNGKVIGIDLPNFVSLKVVETEPGVKGDTATGATKPATVETGAEINVPLFINEGDFLKIDTRTGEYMERVKE
ncbi:MAG: elongation factor P [Deltaproteobacteria bacterium]|nr:elongation factor P [Deltaproteobacteria bacterium]